MKEQENSRGEQLRKALSYTKKNGYDRVDRAELEAMDAYCTGYKQFLDAGKTERECVDRTIALAEAAGFRAYQRGMALKPGDKVYRANRGKAVMLAVLGRRGLDQGVNIAAAHIDSPRLDLKQNPLYEADELAFLKTHYYGGLRKYQWVTIPWSSTAWWPSRAARWSGSPWATGRGIPCSPWTTSCPTWGRSSPESPWERPSPRRA